MNPFEEMSVEQINEAETEFDRIFDTPSSVDRLNQQGICTMQPKNSNKYPKIMFG